MKDLIPWGPPLGYKEPWNTYSLGEFFVERSLTLVHNLRQENKRLAWDGKEYTRQEFRDHYGNDEQWNVIGHCWRSDWHIGLVGSTPFGLPKRPDSHLQCTSGPLFDAWQFEVEAFNGRKWPKAYTLEDGQRFDPHLAEVTNTPITIPRHGDI